MKNNDTEKPGIYRQRKVALSIITIDDSDIDNFIHEIVIMQSGLGDELKTYTSPINALEGLKTEHLNQRGIILLNLNLPVMNGFEFMKAFHQLPEAIRQNWKIVVITSSIDPNERKKAASFPAFFKWIEKPLTNVKFFGLVDEYEKL